MCVRVLLEKDLWCIRHTIGEKGREQHRTGEEEAGEKERERGKLSPTQASACPA